MPHAVISTLSVLALALSASGCGQRVAPGPNDRDILAEAACGQCRLGLPGGGCDLAVRIDGRAFFVDGSGIDDHGDAHAADGLCNAIRPARVRGSIRDGRFVATSFTLLPAGAP